MKLEVKTETKELVDSQPRFRQYGFTAQISTATCTLVTYIEIKKFYQGT